jgi:hypothetical protein
MCRFMNSYIKKLQDDNETMSDGKENGNKLSSETSVSSHKIMLSQPKTVIIVEVRTSKFISRGDIGPCTLNLGIGYCEEVNLYFNWGVGARAKFFAPRNGI